MIGRERGGWSLVTSFSPFPKNSYRPIWDVAIDGTGKTVVVGDVNNAKNGLYFGAIYIYEYDGWTWKERQQLRPSNSQEFLRF